MENFTFFCNSKYESETPPHLWRKSFYSCQAILDKNCSIYKETKKLRYPTEFGNLTMKEVEKKRKKFLEKKKKALLELKIQYKQYKKEAKQIQKK